MGIINVTPDSFADGGRRFDAGRRRSPTRSRMAHAGADLIDIGARVHAARAPIRCRSRKSCAGVVPVLEGLRGRLNVPVSIDTYKAAVADRAIDLGAAIVNDVSALDVRPGAGRGRRRAGACRSS